MFSEWLDHSLVMDQLPQTHSYVQDHIVPEERGLAGTFGQRLYENSNSMVDYIPNSDFLLGDEIEFCTSFSDSFLIDALASEQRSM